MTSRQPLVASCPARDCCLRHIRHENPERWKFCRVKENLKKYKHPVPKHLVGTHYTGYPKDEFCPYDGRSPLSKCPVYSEAVEVGYISDGKVRVESEFIEYRKSIERQS